MGNFDINAAGPLIAGGALLASYRFEKYFTTKKEEEKFSLNNIEILATDINGATRDYLIKKSIVMGVFLARNCVSEPPNVLYPESYAEIIAKELETEGVEVEILGEREMRNLGMGALLGVGQGSNNESKLVVMKYFGSSEDKVHAAFVGKGVTFDTGGISIKPANGMEQMKYDMAGSAAVVGAIKALALRKAKANVVGVVGLVENMPGSKAQRPSDVVKTMSGKTAEVLNTDAEGRLVLADAIWYAQEKFNPECVVDLATLTGAIVVALGNTYGGLFANNDDLANKLIDSGGKIDEKLWRMPLHKDYDDIIKSDIADVANIASVPGVAGSATAAHFIGRFIKNDTPWAHLDIAGMAWEKKGKEICPRGATGYGVRLLNQFIWDNYERK
jgi:leucyl aminopeptidase